MAPINSFVPRVGLARYEIPTIKQGRLRGWSTAPAHSGFCKHAYPAINRWAFLFRPARPDARALDAITRSATWTRDRGPSRSGPGYNMPEAQCHSSSTATAAKVIGSVALTRKRRERIRCVSASEATTPAATPANASAPPDPGPDAARPQAGHPAPCAGRSHACVLSPRRP